MRKLLFTLVLALVAFTVTAQDHLVRRPSKPAKTTTVKPSPAKPSKNNRSGSQKQKPSTSSSTVSCPDGNHPHLIDLGLPSGTKWSCCNVGANIPESAGGYYAWGETETKSNYSYPTYSHCDGKIGTCHNLGSCISGTKYDVAHVKWGGNWQMPTKEQCQELLDNCSHKWTSVNGVRGQKFTSKKTNQSVFFPAVREYVGSSISTSASIACFYWSGTNDTSSSGGAFYFYFYDSGVNVWGDSSRSRGRPVRPVAR